MGIILSIDPGLSGTGVAVWAYEEWEKLVPPVLTKNIYETKGLNHLSVRMDSLWENLWKWKLEATACAQIEGVMIEQPKDFDSVKGQAAAKESSIVKLSMLIGYLTCGFVSKGIPVLYVGVNEWKGQLPKDLVKNRLQSTFPDLKCESHSWDAVGIGLNRKGYTLDGRKIA